ncbi:hypothetical protein [Rubrobacter taiwanensis]|jgi:hypothetical protein|nr:hypothetical protein [Rubrobacter taiwanensis]
MADAALILLQQNGLDTVGLFRFFAAFFLIAIIFGSALLFTYWISKEE